MLEAMYDFTGTIAHTLSFKRGDNFIFHSASNLKRNWWSVIDSLGKIGYIPSNYVSINKVSKGKMLEFITYAIEELDNEILKVGGTEKRLDVMRELNLKKQEILDSKQKTNSIKDKHAGTRQLKNSTTLNEDLVKKTEDQNPPLAMRVSVSETKFPDGKSAEINLDGKNTSNITPHSAYLLIQQVRNQTGLSFEGSRIAVGVVAEGFLELLPSNCVPSLESFLELLQNEIIPTSAIIDDTQDAQNLCQILTHLTNARGDAQQRSWHLWDDEATIKKNITQLSSILSNADPMISKRVFKKNNFDDVLMLVDYYQMEDRSSIRQLLVQAFAVMCTLDKVIINLLLNSVLPMELGREMQSNFASRCKLSKPALLLAMIFSTGEAMPITHLDQLGVDFVKMILEVIELERGSEIADKMLTLILSYNLQFKHKSSANVIIQALQEVTCAKTFSEKVLLLINREEDPLAKLKAHECPCHSVLKLLKDLFSNTATADLFYTNDVKVLIDIVVRQITDLPPNNKKRTEYLELCKLILYCCDSLAFEHRLSELKNVFYHILKDEVPPVEKDKSIVLEITEALPKIFGAHHRNQQCQIHRSRSPR